VSSIAASHKFPWQVLRGPASLIAAYVIGFNIVHGVDKNQWWFPFALVAIAALTTIFEGIYDEPLPGSGIGPMDMSNFTCMLASLGIPVVAFVSGIFHGDWYWWAGSLAVFLANMMLYFGFRQRGDSCLLIAVCLLGLSIF
jgi:hypothetical protein